MRVMWIIYQPLIVTQIQFYIKVLYWRFISTVIKSEGVFSLAHNKMPPFFELQSRLYGEQNPSVKNWPTGKLSSIFVSEIINLLTLPLICSESNSFFFWIEFMFKWRKISLLRLSLHKDFNPLSANPTKWSNTLKQFVGKSATNCLSVFDHFVGLAPKGIRRYYYNHPLMLCNAYSLLLDEFK